MKSRSQLFETELDLELEFRIDEFGHYELDKANVFVGRMPVDVLPLLNKSQVARLENMITDVEPDDDGDFSGAE